MTIQEKIAAILDQPVFGGELWYLQRPDSDGRNVAHTFGVYLIAGGETFQDLEGDLDLSRPRVQVSIYSTSATQFAAKIRAVRDAMRAANNLVAVDPANTLALNCVSAGLPVESFDPDTRHYYAHLDFHCWDLPSVETTPVDAEAVTFNGEAVTFNGESVTWENT